MMKPGDEVKVLDLQQITNYLASDWLVVLKDTNTLATRLKIWPTSFLFLELGCQPMTQSCCPLLRRALYELLPVCGQPAQIHICRALVRGLHDCSPKSCSDAIRHDMSKTVAGRSVSSELPTCAAMCLSLALRTAIDSRLPTLERSSAVLCC